MAIANCRLVVFVAKLPPVGACAFFGMPACGERKGDSRFCGVLDNAISIARARLQVVREFLSCLSEADVESRRPIDPKRAAGGGKRVADTPIAVLPCGAWYVAEVEGRSINPAVLVAVIVAYLESVDDLRVLGEDLAHACNCKVASVACDGRDADDAHHPLLTVGALCPFGAFHLPFILEHAQNVIKAE
eukprot:scaffold37874_cov31-Tisochrysis_lutea.AAC.4